MTTIQEERPIGFGRLKRKEDARFIRGKGTYLDDIELPGMVHGRVIRPPAMGATLLSIDESSVSGIPGIFKVVRQNNFLAVLAETEWAAIKASQRLKANWSPWAALPDERRLWEHVRATRVAKEDITSNVGGTGAGITPFEGYL